MTFKMKINRKILTEILKSKIPAYDPLSISRFNRYRFTNPLNLNKLQRDLLIVFNIESFVQSSFKNLSLNFFIADFKMSSDRYI